MGIDARLLIRDVPEEQVSDDRIRQWSVALCTSIGSRYFWIDRERGRHAISRTDPWSDDAKPGQRYDQDGPSIIAREGECLLEVHLWTRFYDVGYERGDLILLCAIAEWIEHNIVGASVWYGGDSSGCCAKPFAAMQRYLLKRHLFSEKGRDYFDYDARGFGLMSTDGIKVPLCDLCKIPLGRYGWGASYAAAKCRGCGLNLETRDSGITWVAKKDEML